MIKKLLILIVILYLLTLLQTGFLAHFLVWGRVLNLVLILIILWNFFENPKNYLGLYTAAIGGFFLDIFSSHFIGYNILILLGISILIKLIFRRYVKIPFLEET